MTEEVARLYLYCGDGLSNVSRFVGDLVAWWCDARRTAEVSKQDRSIGFMLNGLKLVMRRFLKVSLGKAVKTCTIVTRQV
jgi:hypothetical protein